MVTVSEEGIARVWNITTGAVVAVEELESSNKPKEGKMEKNDLFMLDEFSIISTTLSNQDKLNVIVRPSAIGQNEVTASWKNTVYNWDIANEKVYQVLNNCPQRDDDGTQSKRKPQMPFTPNQREEEKLFDLLTLEQKLEKTSAQRLYHLQNIWQQLTLEQKSEWSFQLLSWWWQQIAWQDVDLTQFERFAKHIVTALGQTWQFVTWQQKTPQDYHILLLRTLETIWEEASLEQQEWVLDQLVTLTPLLSNGNFENQDGWEWESDGAFATTGQAYHGKRFVALESSQLGSWVSQAISTIPGQTYTLSFALSGQSSEVSQVQVLWDEMLLTELIADGRDLAKGETAWQVYEYSIVAADEEATLVFQVEPRQGVYLDAIYLTSQ